MDYHLIDYNIRQKNYSLWRSCKNKFDIIKNERGTYGEYNDFMISIVLSDNNNYIDKWVVITDDKNYKKEIEKNIHEIMSEGNVQLDKFCFSVVDRF